MIPDFRAEDDPEPRNPDCEQGKHGACSGYALDEPADLICCCQCACHDRTVPLRVQMGGAA